MILRSAAATVFAAGLALLSGCGPSPAPQFTLSEKTRLLLPEVRDGMSAKNEEGKEVRLAGVKENVDRRFGTLAEPNIWPLLPVDFGGKPAKVAKVIAPTPEVAEKAEADEIPFEEMVVALERSGEEALEAPAGSQAAWASGATYEGIAHRVKAFDAETGQVTLVGKFDSGLPAEGDELLLEAGTLLAKGQALYARHCLHCHGAGGAGDGPTAKYLDPKPRDYRLGIYKFTSTAAPEKASREDLADILRHGIPGTAMPAYRLLESEDPQALHAIVEYIRWLSMRGEYESQLAAIPTAMEYTAEAVEKRVADGEKREEVIAEVRDFLEVDFAEQVEPTGEDLASAWGNADTPEALINPTIPRVPDTPESRARGRELYLSDRTKCASCHGPYGRGDGPQTETIQNNLATNEPYPQPGFFDAWGNPIKPRDLTQGIYRGGRRPIDLFRRMYAGIKGTPMPAFGGSLKEEEIWDIVNFVLHAPHEPLPEAGSGKSLVSSTAH